MAMELNIIRLNVDRVEIEDGSEYLGDWFNDQGYERALQCVDPSEANDILVTEYKGPDTDGDQLDWSPKYYKD